MLQREKAIKTSINISHFNCLSWKIDECKLSIKKFYELNVLDFGVMFLMCADDMMQSEFNDKFGKRNMEVSCSKYV
jgi:hypothetical protein